MELQIAKNFRIDSEPECVERYGSGHIHETYRLTTQSGRHYIIQRLNEEAFRNIDGLMENIVSVCDYLIANGSSEREALNVVRTLKGSSYYRDETGAYRMYDFIEGGVCLDEAKNKEDFYESARAFGRFTSQLKDFPVEKLHETIPHFHDTPDRYRIFKEKVQADSCGRAASCQREIEFYLSREDRGSELMSLLKKGILPLRVTHNDTKLNNVMLDINTGKSLCVLDLDTTMPGLAAFDFGDSIRFGAATAAEDEKQYELMKLDLDKFEIYSKGYMETCTMLTKEEVDSLCLGAFTMTLECGMRFLTDYLDGDKYFHVAYDTHNLVRARTQMQMVLDMERKWDKMISIVDKLSCGY